jgi:hypothetical protein
MFQSFYNCHDGPLLKVVAYGEQCCQSFSKRYGFSCTRPEGHDGVHAGHGIDDFRPVAIWDEEDSANTVPIATIFQEEPKEEDTNVE